LRLASIVPISLLIRLPVLLLLLLVLLLVLVLLLRPLPRELLLVILLLLLLVRQLLGVPRVGRRTATIVSCCRGTIAPRSTVALRRLRLPVSLWRLPLLRVLRLRRVLWRLPGHVLRLPVLRLLPLSTALGHWPARRVQFRRNECWGCTFAGRVQFAGTPRGDGERKLVRGHRRRR